MTRQNQAGLEEEIAESAVADFLTRNPDFFQRHPDLSAELKIPHPCGDAVSLLEYQARLMRERYRDLHRRLDELLQVARDNDRLAERMHRLTLELITADSFHSAVDAVKIGLRSEFQADSLSLKLFTPQADQEDRVATDHKGLEPFRDSLRTGQPRCGRLAADSLKFLFADSAVSIGSAAVIPLVDDSPLGLLAVGSYDAEHFHSGQGTVFLRQLGAVIARTLNKHLQ